MTYLDHAGDHIGFTGTQAGMTMAQQTLLLGILAARYGWLHHGDCVGGDEQAHRIARDLGSRWKIAAHPPLAPRKRAWCEADLIHEPKEYLKRDHDIVRATMEMIGAPRTMTEVLRSGTWATIRFARELGRPITLIWPNGTITHEVPKVDDVPLFGETR